VRNVKALMAVLSVTTIVTAYAECDFPYYPEYADVFSQYDEVTPLMAKKAVIASPIFGEGVKRVVCEPLILKDNEGMPFCYMVATYAGSDLTEVRMWNKLIKKINKGVKLPAAELAEEIGYLYNNEFQTHISTYVVSPYTYNPPILATSEKQFDGLAGYVSAYELATVELSGKPIFLSRIIGIGYWMAQIFVFSDSDGETTAVETDEYYRAEKVDIDKYAVIRRNKMKATYGSLKDHRDVSEKNEKSWSLILEKVPDDEANEEFPRQTSFSQKTEETDGEFWYCRSDTPDPN
jgi:hypothetical protein